MKKIRKLIMLVFTLSMLFALVACSSSDSETATTTDTTEEKTEETTASGDEEVTVVEEVESVSGGTITTMIQTEPDSLDPFIAVAADTTSLLYNVYDGLMTLNEDGTMASDLAESYQVSEDGLTYSFIIKDTAFFSTGDPVTIEDVVYSYDKYMEASSMFSNVESVSSEGNTLIVKLIAADASFITLCNYGVVPNDPSLDLNVTPIGSGPYMITDYVSGSELVFEKNPYYNTNPDRIPHVDKVIVKVNLSDPSVTLNQLLAGDLDLCQFMDPSTADMVEGKGYQVIAAPSNTVQILAMNPEFEPFSNVAVRQAISYAVDSQAIVDNIMYGKGQALVSHMSPAMSAFYADDLENTYSEVDLDKAKELLKEAGYEDGFTFTIKVPSSYQRHVDTGLIIKDMLSKINITVEVEQIEWATWLEDVYANRQYEGTIIGIAGKPDPDTILKIYTTTYSRNFYNYSNPVYDELIDAGKLETDVAKRAEIYKESQQILVDDAVCVYTMDPANVKYAKASVGGIKNYSVYFIDMASLFLKAE